MREDVGMRKTKQNRDKYFMIGSNYLQPMKNERELPGQHPLLLPNYKQDRVLIIFRVTLHGNTEGIRLHIDRDSRGTSSVNAYSVQSNRDGISILILF